MKTTKELENAHLSIQTIKNETETLIETKNKEIEHLKKHISEDQDSQTQMQYLQRKLEVIILILSFCKYIFVLNIK
mgnify:CR=1 FL=1